MAEKKKPTVPQTPEQLATNVRSYYTKDILAQMSEMTTKQMENLLKDLPSTPHWIAILKYSSMRTPLLDATLRGTDPVKEPSKMSWAQGAMAGLCDLETYVIDLSSPTPSSIDEPGDDEPVSGRPEGVIVG